GMPTQDVAASITFVVLAGWCLKLTGAGERSTEPSWPWSAKWEARGIAAVLVCFCAGTVYDARTDLRPAVRAERAAFPYRYGFGAIDENDREFQWTARHAVSVFPKENRYLRIVLGPVAPDAAARPVEVKVWRGD